MQMHMKRPSDLWPLTLCTIVEDRCRTVTRGIAALGLATLTMLCLPVPALAAEGAATSTSAEIRGGGIHVIPRPAQIEAGAGHFTLTAQTAILVSPETEGLGRALGAMLAPATGFRSKVVTAAFGTARAGAIALSLSGDAGRLGDEGYELQVLADRVSIKATKPAGLFYGCQTLRQLLPSQIFSSTPVKDAAWTMPCVTITDRPRFAWRGLMLDSGHDFQRLDFVKRYIDLMALHKFNLFHWHLTDLGTWSIEIKGRPKLLEAATRGPGVKPGSYTQEEIREVVRYAAERYITVMPEIDMPGHEPPALLAYPELDCPLPRGVDKNGKPVRPWQFCVGNEKTYAFLEEVLSQVVDLFPGPYVHIGGDECPKDRWLKCPLCQARMQESNLKNGEELQSYFIQRIGKFLQSKGRRMIGWDEILEGGLAPNATVMSWRGMGGGIAAAKAGHDVVMAPTEWTYFDYPNTPLAKGYSFEPVPKELTAAQAEHVLGAQAQMWTDNHPSEARIDALVYPRAAALAEVVWSPAASRDYQAFEVRLQAHLPRLVALGVRYMPLSKNTGTPVGNWSTKKLLATPEIMEWSLTKGITGAGRYRIKFQYEGGASRLMIHGVEIVQEGKVLATDKHSGFTGASDVDNEYHVELPQLSAAPLTLRATVSTDEVDSRGRVQIEKTP